ncbi:MAG TPA: SDR family NAD(P)-dependent oxidoreductase [Anaerolineae bacterium]|jgi:hypothetical protein
MNAVDFKARFGPWALIAGASVGLGAAYAEQIAARGLNVVLVARRASALDELCQQLKANYKVEARAIPLDLARDDAAQVLAATLSDVEVGLLVCNAALSVIGPFLDRSLDEHLAEIAINCRTPMSLAYTFGQPMRARRRGGILFMSSLTAQQGTATIANYAATKAYNLILAEGLWEELRYSGVTVMACCAGAISTPNYLDSLSDRTPRAAPPGTLTPDAVARETLAAFGKQGSFIPGFTNKSAAFVLRRLMPRGLTVRMMGRVMRGLYGDYTAS